MLVTDAIVLHAFDYRETSRILRLATRDAGVQSVIARGARRPGVKFSAALDLLVEGVAHVALSPSRDLHTLAQFDVVRARVGLASSWRRFVVANALGEIVLRCGGGDANAALFESLSDALAAVERSGDSATAAGLAGAWALTADLGFAPSLDACATCAREFDVGEAVPFSHRAGGALCDGCARADPRARVIPQDARALIAAWATRQPAASSAGPTGPAARAHIRLLREFLEAHADGGTLRALALWEREERSPR